MSEKKYDYEGTQSIYNREDEKKEYNEDYDFLKFAKLYIDIKSKFDRSLDNSSNMQLFDVIGYLQKMYKNTDDKYEQGALDDVRDAIISVINARNPQQNEEIDEYPKNKI